MGLRPQSTFSQLDELENPGSAAQAQNGWTAEGIFGRVTMAPSLRGPIPVSFLKYAEAAHVVSYVNQLWMKLLVKPSGWDECLAFMNEALGKQRSH